MAIIYPQHQQPQIDRRAEALSRINDAFNSAATLRDLQNQKHLSSAMFGTPGADFGDLTKKHAPGLDPKLAGPALAVTKDAMAKPGLMTGGSWAGLNDQQRGAVQNAMGGFGGGGGFGGSGNMMQMALARALMGGGR